MTITECQDIAECRRLHPEQIRTIAVGGEEAAYCGLSKVKKEAEFQAKNAVISYLLFDKDTHKLDTSDVTKPNPEAPCCPNCKSRQILWTKTKKIFWCRKCGKEFKEPFTAKG